MYFSMNVLKNRHGVYVVRKKVPKGLQEAAANVLGKGKSRQTFLQKSLETKDHAAAKTKAPAVLMHFDRVLERARQLASVSNQPTPTTLGPAEINLIAQHFYARMLDHDERWRFGGKA